MENSDSIFKILNEYKIKMNGNARIRKILKDWSPLMHFIGSDNQSAFSMQIDRGEITSITQDHSGTPDLIITALSSDLADMFSGKLNPTEKYLNGEISVRGTQTDIIKLDAITMILWPED